MEYSTDFNEAHRRTDINEGFRSDLKVDPGGETYCGIARNKWPDWEGWKLVDSNQPVPEDMVKCFYLTNFWDDIRGGMMASLSSEVAIKIFDISVNAGRSKAISVLQDALSLLNLNGKLYPDLKVDGRMGELTLFSLKANLKDVSGSFKINEARLLKVIEVLIDGFRIELMRAHPEKEIFRGWYTRI